MPDKEFTIGADPEFCGYLPGSGVVYADNYGSYNTPIGCDGNGQTFEVRPTPSECPLQVVKSIRSHLERHSIQYPEFIKLQWLAGSIKHDQSLGGHIHFGTKRKISGREGTRLLSVYAGSLLALVEDEVEGKKRRVEHEYGLANDFRIQPYGFEYRTPSSWLASPHMTAAALCLAKIVIFEAINNKQFSPSNHIEERDINCMNITALRKAFPQIWSDIIKMKLYPQYSTELQYLYNLITNQKNWYLNKTGNFRPAWRIKAPQNVLPSCSITDIWCNKI